MTEARFTHSFAVLVSATLMFGCGGADGEGAKRPDGITAARRADGTIIDDKSMCDWKKRKDVEVSETAGPGAIQPNVRRVWQVFGGGTAHRRILICREVDTNLDGIKDVVRFYNDEGQSKEERADTNYDGKIDTWNLFVKGRLAEERIDRNHDGHYDELKVYLDGKLSRVKRDTNFDRKWDTWEMYRKGRLERMGVDLDGDERVDRWDKDTEWLRKLKEAEREKEEEAAKKREARADKVRKEAEAAAEKATKGEGQ